MSASTPKRTFFDREMESLISTVSSSLSRAYGLLTTARTMNAQTRKNTRASPFASGLQAPQLRGMKGAKCVASQQDKGWWTWPI